MENKIKEITKEITKEFKIELTREDIKMLSEKEMNLNEIEEALDNGDIHFEKNMTETIMWQNDDYESSTILLKKLLNIKINREFLEKYIEADCENMADFANAYLTEHDGEVIKLNKSVAYIHC